MTQIIVASFWKPEVVYHFCILPFVVAKKVYNNSVRLFLIIPINYSIFLCRVHILVVDLTISYHMWYFYQCFCKHQTGLEQHFSTRASQALLVKYDINWTRRKSCRVFSKIFVWILCNQFTNKVMKFQHNTRYSF